MCLFSTRPKWEDDVHFSNRPSHRHSRTRVSETIITKRANSPRPVQYIQARPPRASTPVIRPATPPPPPPQIELVSVEEEHRASPRTSRISVSTKGRRRESRGGEDVYIERERIRERMPPPQPKEGYETYRYVEAPQPPVETIDRQRSHSITYETNPRHSGRMVERERVVVEDGGRRREYYRRP